MNIPESVARRFWKKVWKSDGCWLWTGGTTGRPRYKYGSFMFNYHNYQAHTFAYLLLKGDFLRSFKILHHKCRNRLCVNPEHLEITTQSEHMKKHRSKDW